ncbi:MULTISPECIES: type IX secretion system periplasmic lipoprotein PorW/SprE [unclassified Flavobacterium]|uniref:type IX secretion system periplasmic lipoprotein PorW/SprE n=1 Tax=unclassified Flavobacterium TaxID=196869 RepID=UPI003F8E6B4D
MKNPNSRFLIPCGFLFFLVACSTKNNTFLARNSHALSTEYNILYNGQIALDKGIEGIKGNSTDDFWKRLPIEKMQISDELSEETKSKNTDFELAETKATKAIQKHSMNIGGKERNSQIDEAYLLLGKARYYDQRFIPALDAFNFILYKYPSSSKIYEAKIWREKTNMRLGNDALVVNNISRLLKDKQLKKQVFSDANALLSEAFINLEEKDSAISKLKLAEQFSTKNEQKARYRFILGQLYEELGHKDSARQSYNAVIAMNRKSERKYVIQSQARIAQLFDYQKGDTTALIKNYAKLLEDRENRPFLDVLNYQMGVFYDKQNNEDQALKYYNASLDKVTTDDYLMASNYRNMGNMYFKKASYPIAAKYYDSTLVKLNPKTREYIHINKVRKDLDEVILYEDIATRNDSILTLVALSDGEKQLYFENYISKLKELDEAKRIASEKQQEKQENIDRNNKVTTANPMTVPQDMGNTIQGPPALPPSMSTPNPAVSTFYFYTPTTVSFGKIAFKKNWGNRSSEGNWRLSTNKNNNFPTDNVALNNNQELDSIVSGDQFKEEYTTDFYIKQLPTNQFEIDSIAKERNAAYYQLGVIYKEKLKEYQLATTKLEQLLQNNPQEKLVLPALYNLYKIYQITDSQKAAEIKNKIVATYPNSRYAQIISNTNQGDPLLADTPENAYAKIYKSFANEQYKAVLEQIDPLIIQFSGEEIVSKLELLKANTLGKLNGVADYKKALQFVADTYPNTEEGKKANEIVERQIPLLEKMDFTTNDSHNWKILYRMPSLDDQKRKEIEEKIKKYLATEFASSISYSLDPYSANEHFLTINGSTSEQQALQISSILKENKSYKINETAIIISNDNYKVVQIKKNLDAYLASKK